MVVGKRNRLDLDVDSPDEVSAVLFNAVEEYNYGASQLAADWQDPSAGEPWEEIAKILARAARQIDEKLEAIGW
jgi:hypothetical protein